MKKICLSILALLALTSCTVQFSRSESTAELSSSSFDLAGGFEAIEVMGSPTVVYQQADSTSVTVKGPTEQVKNIDIQVNGGKLKVSSKSKMSLLRSSSVDDVVVYVTSPDLIEAIVSGSGDFICKSPVDTDTLRLYVGGSGDIDMTSVVCDKLDAEVLGSGDVEVNQAVTQLAALRIVGSGDIEVGLRNTQSTQISLTGSGDISVRFDRCVDADCQLEGSGDIKLSGSLRTLTSRTAGSGEIDQRSLSLERK